jgi:hypothetical protein
VPDGFRIVQPGQAFVSGALAGVADVDDEEWPPVPGWEELAIEAGAVEPSHGPGGQAGCADGDDEVGGLHPRAAGADLVPGNLVVEGAVSGQDGVDRRLGRLTDVPGLQVR